MSGRPLQAAAAQDLSGFGRCSLTVALPVLSAMGVQVSCLPTAVLSTHTGGFEGYTFLDMTDEMHESICDYLVQTAQSAQIEAWRDELTVEYTDAYNALIGK